MRAVIMAGGAGTRLKSVSGDMPKPMVRICGKPVLEYQIENLVRYGVRDITIIINHTGGLIRRHFGDGSGFNADIKYIVEKGPLGTAGGLFFLEDKKEAFLLLNGDLLFDVDFKEFIGFYENQKNCKAALYVHPNSHPHDSDVCELDEKCRIIKWHKKNENRDFYYHNIVNAGLYVLSVDVFNELDGGKKDLDRDIIKAWVDSGCVYGYKCTEYIKDIGTPDRYASAEADLKNGIVAARNRGNMQRAIFFDRDGTLNKTNGFIASPEQLVLNDGAAEAVKMVNDLGYLAIVITNQPVIARGEATEQDLDAIHAKLEMELGKKGAYIDGLFYCPHHPDSGFAGERAELKIKCGCRKPAPGLILEAANKYNIDLVESWMIGDSVADMECGKNAGTKAFLIKPDKNLYIQIEELFVKNFLGENNDFDKKTANSWGFA